MGSEILSTNTLFPLMTIRQGYLSFWVTRMDGFKADGLTYQVDHSYIWSSPFILLVLGLKTTVSLGFHV